MSTMVQVQSWQEQVEAQQKKLDSLQIPCQEPLLEVIAKWLRKEDPLNVWRFLAAKCDVESRKRAPKKDTMKLKFSGIPDGDDWQNDCWATEKGFNFANQNYEEIASLNPDMHFDDEVRDMGDKIAQTCKSDEFLGPIAWISMSKLFLFKSVPKVIEIAEEREAIAGLIHDAVTLSRGPRPWQVGHTMRGTTSWLVCAIAALAENQSRDAIDAVFERCPEIIPENSDGPFTIMLHDPKRNYKETEVRVNDRVPLEPLPAVADTDTWNDFRPIFSRTLDNSMWFGLLEKAIAKLVGGYQKLRELERCPPAFIWSLITGDTRFGILFPWAAIQGDSNSKHFSAVKSTDWGISEYSSIETASPNMDFETLDQNNCINTDDAFSRIEDLERRQRPMAVTFNTAMGRRCISKSLASRQKGASTFFKILTFIKILCS